MDYYFDEQLPPSIAGALDLLESHEGKNRVYSTSVAFSKGITDSDLFQKIRESNGILVTHDLKMVTRRKEFSLIRELGISVFLVSLPSGADYEMIWRTIVEKWPAIKEWQRKHRNKPIVCRIPIRGKPVILEE